MVGDDLFEVVNIVHEHILKVVEARVEIARHAEVNQEHGPPFALLQGFVNTLRGEVIGAAAGRANYHIGQVQLPGELLERYDGPGAGAGQLDRPLEGPVGDEQGTDGPGPKLADGLLAHLSHANDHGGLVGQLVKNPTRQFDRHRADRDGFGRNGGFTPHAFGDREGLVEPAVEHRPQRAERGRGAIRVFDLSQDLGFAHDQGIEAGGDAEHVSDRIPVGMGVQMGFKQPERQALLLGQKGFDVAAGLWRIVGPGHDFDPVAGRDDRAFLDAGRLDQAGQGVVQHAVAEGQFLAHLDRRRMVVEANDHQAGVRLSQIRPHADPAGAGLPGMRPGVRQNTRWSGLRRVVRASRRCDSGAGRRTRPS